jgi:hypothetical protein
VWMRALRNMMRRHMRKRMHKFLHTATMTLTNGNSVGVQSEKIAELNSRQRFWTWDWIGASCTPPGIRRISRLGNCRRSASPHLDRFKIRQP